MVVVDDNQIDEKESLNFVTKDIIVREAGLQFSVLLLTHKPDQSSKLVRLEFDESFVEAIKEKLVEPIQMKKVMQ